MKKTREKQEVIQLIFQLQVIIYDSVYDQVIVYYLIEYFN